MRPGSRPGKGCPGQFILAAAAVVTVLLLFLFTAAQWLRRAAEPWHPAAAADGIASSSGRVILLLADRLTFTDLLQGAGPNLSRFLEQGAVALMNVRSGRAGSESGYLSFGTAARAAAGPEGRIACEGEELVAGEQAAVVFKRCTGNDPAGALFHLQTVALQEKNSTLPYPVTVGLLGESLQERGLAAAVWGNADGASPNRSAVLVAMNTAGEVCTGAVGTTLLQDAPLFPYGVRTDIDKLAGTVAENIGRADLHLVEFGDSSRLDEYWPQLNPSRGAVLFRETMNNLDLLAGKLFSLLGENDSLLLAVPSLPLNRPDSGDRLAPVILTAGGGPTPGLLGSASTRRPGLIQNTDLAALILTLLDRGDSDRPAASFSIIPQQNPPAFLEELNRRSALVFEQRALLLKPYIAFLVLVLLGSLGGMLLRIFPVLRPASCLIGALLMVPPVLLLLPGVLPFPFPAASLSGLLLCGTALLPALLMQPLADKRPALYWLIPGWGIALALLLDTLTGAPLQQLSLFSYDPVGGARYYGMGNEYMGVLIGAALLGTVSLAAAVAGPIPSGRSKPPAKSRLFPLVAPAILLFYGIILFILAAPEFGANLGGCLTAAAAFGVAWAGLTGVFRSAGGQRKKIVPGVILFLAASAGLLWLLNIYRPGVTPSHIGLFGKMLRLRGPAGFQEIALRKLAMNLKLMRYSIWSRAFVTLVGLCVVLSFHHGGFLKRFQGEQPYLVTGVSAALAGAAAALLTNDSGVVAAATLLLYAVPPALLVVMQKNLNRRQT